MRISVIEGVRLCIGALPFIASLMLCGTVFGQAATSNEPWAEYYPEPSASALRLAETLDQEISLNFQQLPLGKVAESLQDQLGVPVTIATRALEDAGVTAETPISFRISKVRARTALDLMFKSWDMQVVEQEDFLLITMQDKADGMRFARVYPVGDLVPEELVVLRVGGTGTGSGAGVASALAFSTENRSCNSSQTMTL